MKLLIIYHSGLADDAKYIFREYARQGIDLTVIVPQKNGSLIYKTVHDESAFKYVALQCKAVFNFFQLFSAIKKINPEVIHVLDEYTSLVLFETILCKNILFGKKVPVFSLSFQNLPLTPNLVFTSITGFSKRVVYKMLIPFLMYYHKKNLAGIVGGNKEAMDILKKIGVNIPMKFIFWGVNLDLFYPKGKEECRENLGIPKQVKLIGYFGKIMKEKGLENLVRAVSQLNNYHLLLVGNGEYKDELKKIIASVKIQNRVYFYDSVRLSELIDYYNCLDTYVLPTYTTSGVKEQYGRVLIEAMACKVSIIGSNCGAIPEVLEGYPAHLIFNEYSLLDLVDKINKIENVRLPEDFDVKKFLYKFSVENFVVENIKFYNEFIRK